MSLEDATKTLTYFGLSFNQAKVYLALGSALFSSVNKIQKKTGVPRQEIYRILERLYEKGLVESTMERPRKYRSISLSEGISFLLKNKNKEMEEMNKKAEEIISNVSQVQCSLSSMAVEPDFVTIPKDYATLLRRSEEIHNATKQIDFLISWQRFPQIVTALGGVAREALEKGVKIRAILEKPEHRNNMPDIVKVLKKFSNYKLKFILHEPSALIGIFDQRRVIIETSPNTPLAGKSSLWSNNPSFVSIIIDYYEKIWEEC